MKRNTEKIIYKTPIFNIEEDSFEGRTFIKIDSPDWVNIIPLNEKNEILLIKQYRYGTQNIITETPGGIIDPTDKSPLEAAKRELLEETGFESNNWENMGWVYANPAYQTNKCFFFMAKNIKQIAAPKLDFDEKIIESFFVSAKKAFDMLKTGEINHSIIFAILSTYFIKTTL